jgi:type VI secretion system secreted protein VgrG
MIFALNYKKIEFKLCEAIYEVDGYPVEYYFTLTDDSNKVYTTTKNEVYVENEEIIVSVNLKDLAKEVKIDLPHLMSLKGFVIIDDDIRDTGIIKYTPILQHKIWKRDTILNNTADETQKRSYKKTKPATEDEEVKLIQKALQRMKIDIGKDGIDGKYGNDAEQAVKNFQTNYKPTHNIHTYNWADEPDGIVGKNTLLAMDEALVEGWRVETVENLLITKEMINAVCPNKGDDSDLLRYLNEYAIKYEVNTKYRIAHFISQIAHESCFKATEENLHFTLSRAKELWGRTKASKHKYIKFWDNPEYFKVKNGYINPEIYANYVYKNKVGNGDEASGDGFKYRGRGLVQLTGKANYKNFTKIHNIKSPDDKQDFLINPDLIFNNKKYAIESAFVFWKTNNLNAIVHGANVAMVTKKINGGNFGLNDRQAKFDKLINNWGKLR